MTEFKTLKLKSPCGQGYLSFEWNESINNKLPSDSIMETIRWVCKEYSVLKSIIDIKVIRQVDRSSYDDMQALCARFNHVIDTFLSMSKGTSMVCGNPIASSELLKWIMDFVYMRAISQPLLLNRCKPNSLPETYGETSYEQVKKILQKLNIQPDDTFIDLGSGIGHIVLQVAASTQCRSCVGIEKESTRAHYAIQMDKQFGVVMKWFGKKFHHYQLINGDFLDAEHIDLIYQSTIIFVNNFAFREVNHKLKGLFGNLDNNTRIVSTYPFRTEYFKISDRNLDDPAAIMRVSKYMSDDGAFSWTQSPVPYYIHIIDRSLLQEYFDIKNINETKKTHHHHKHHKKHKPTTLVNGLQSSLHNENSSSQTGLDTLDSISETSSVSSSNKTNRSNSLDPNSVATLTSSFKPLLEKSLRLSSVDSLESIPSQHKNPEKGVKINGKRIPMASHGIMPKNFVKSEKIAQKSEAKKNEKRVCKRYKLVEPPVGESGRSDRNKTRKMARTRKIGKNSAQKRPTVYSSDSSWDNSDTLVQADPSDSLSHSSPVSFIERDSNSRDSLPLFNSPKPTLNSFDPSYRKIDVVASTIATTRNPKIKETSGRTSENREEMEIQDMEIEEEFEPVTPTIPTDAVDIEDLSVNTPLKVVSGMNGLVDVEKMPPKSTCSPTTHLASSIPYFIEGTKVIIENDGPCKAKISKVHLNLKIKIRLKDNKFLSLNQDQINGPLEIGGLVEVIRNDDFFSRKGTVEKISDHSDYTIELADGRDKKVVKRSAIKTVVEMGLRNYSKQNRKYPDTKKGPSSPLLPSFLFTRATEGVTALPDPDASRTHSIYHPNNNHVTEDHFSDFEATTGSLLEETTNATTRQSNTVLAKKGKKRKGDFQSSLDLLHEHTLNSVRLEASSSNSTRDICDNIISDHQSQKICPKPDNVCLVQPISGNVDDGSVFKVVKPAGMDGEQFRVIKEAMETLFQDWFSLYGTLSRAIKNNNDSGLMEKFADQISSQTAKNQGLYNKIVGAEQAKREMVAEISKLLQFKMNKLDSSITKPMNLSHFAKNVVNLQHNLKSSIVRADTEIDYLTTKNRELKDRIGEFSRLMAPFSSSSSTFCNLPLTALASFNSSTASSFVPQNGSNVFIPPPQAPPMLNLLTNFSTLLPLSANSQSPSFTNNANVISNSNAMKGAAANMLLLNFNGLDNTNNLSNLSNAYLNPLYHPLNLLNPNNSAGLDKINDNKKTLLFTKLMQELERQKPSFPLLNNSSTSSSSGNVIGTFQGSLPNFSNNGSLSDLVDQGACASYVRNVIAKAMIESHLANSLPMANGTLRCQAQNAENLVINHSSQNALGDIDKEVSVKTNNCEISESTSPNISNNHKTAQTSCQESFEQNDSNLAGAKVSLSVNKSRSTTCLFPKQLPATLKFSNGQNGSGSYNSNNPNTTSSNFIDNGTGIQPTFKLAATPISSSLVSVLEPGTSVNLNEHEIDNSISDNGTVTQVLQMPTQVTSASQEDGLEGTINTSSFKHSNMTNSFDSGKSVISFASKTCLAFTLKSEERIAVMGSSKDTVMETTSSDISLNEEMSYKTFFKQITPQPLMVGAGEKFFKRSNKESRPSHKLNHLVYASSGTHFKSPTPTPNFNSSNGNFTPTSIVNGMEEGTIPADKLDTFSTSPLPPTLCMPSQIVSTTQFDTSAMEMVASLALAHLKRASTTDPHYLELPSSFSYTHGYDKVGFKTDSKTESDTEEQLSEPSVIVKNRSVRSVGSERDKPLKKRSNNNNNSGDCCNESNSSSLAAPPSVSPPPPPLTLPNSSLNMNGALFSSNSIVISTCNTSSSVTLSKNTTNTTIHATEKENNVDAAIENVLKRTANAPPPSNNTPRISCPSSLTNGGYPLIGMQTDYHHGQNFYNGVSLPGANYYSLPHNTNHSINTVNYHLSNHLNHHNIGNPNSCNPSSNNQIRYPTRNIHHGPPPPSFLMYKPPLPQAISSGSANSKYHLPYAASDNANFQMYNYNNSNSGSVHHYPNTLDYNSFTNLNNFSGSLSNNNHSTPNSSFMFFPPSMVSPGNNTKPGIVPPFNGGLEGIVHKYKTLEPLQSQHSQNLNAVLNITPQLIPSHHKK
ncbi:unnamed protein product [Gordionus sp. m RMFG-2023]|uniref:uncharacterized protein LOC135928972 n=1 Tax=Gordionus sp. m RMFG-2023 TaxID=3053472 RepID=UPI0030E2780E